MNKTEDQIEEIIEDVVQNYQSWHIGTRNYDGKGRREDGNGSVYAIEQARMIEKLTSRLEKLENTPSQSPSPSTIPPPSATLLSKGKGKMIETQLAQLASTIKEQQVHTSLPPQGQPPKQLYAIMTRSGKTLDDGATHVEAPSSRGETSMGNESSNRDDAEEKSRVDDMSDGDKSKETHVPPLPTPFSPYPHRHKWDVHFAKFLVILRQLYVTIPFTDAFILNKTPPKLKDPGSFSIHCAIKELEISNALCDLGASLGVGDLVPTNITLQLADRSVKYPIGKVEDVPLVGGKLTFLVDFVLLDIDEDSHTPIILGRPFLATAGDLIDVQEGLITLKAGDAKASFKLAIDEHCCSKMKSCMKIDTLACVENNHSCANSSNNFHVSKCANELSRSSLDDKDVHGIPKALGDGLMML
ncbi:uncharacterized protein [Spinacia oleracea]|uniref:Aspartic peptidase DDI1-type domain-containing protein n=1 Tax=Spinacia oleracea TaxID=3562 RepID=A0ABM3QXP6_SPIOL|nr:uncharacterized protein LOC130463114 [Spinacia oleracea]